MKKLNEATDLLQKQKKELNLDAPVDHRGLDQARNIAIESSIDIALASIWTAMLQVRILKKHLY